MLLPRRLALGALASVVLLDLAAPAQAQTDDATTTVAPATPTSTVAPTTTAAAPAVAPGANETLVATANARTINVYATATDTKPLKTLDAKKTWSNALVFVVRGATADRYLVELPMRPNGRRGYVRIADVTLTKHTYDLTIDISERSLVLRKDGKELVRDKVGVGTAKAPTPLGDFYLNELTRPANPKGDYGPYAYGTTAYSTVYQTFGRGDGQIGIHGTNKPNLLGTAVSHGCIRVRNETITKLAKMLPLGTPVHFVA